MGQESQIEKERGRPDRGDRRPAKQIPTKIKISRPADRSSTSHSILSTSLKIDPTQSCAEDRMAYLESVPAVGKSNPVKLNQTLRQ